MNGSGLVDFIESPRFPECVAYGAVGGPRFMTNVVRVVSGREQRNIVWAEQRGEWDVAQAVKTIVELKELREFFYMVRGMAYGFRFRDYTDYQCAATEGVVQDVGTSPTQYQLYKRYTSGSHYYDRKISKPVVGTVVVYLNGNPRTVTLDTASGRFTLPYVSGEDYPPGTLTWSGEFDVPVRFDSDHMPVSIENLNAYTWGQIKLVEVRVD